MMSGFLRLFSVLISKKFHVHLSVAFYHNVQFATYFFKQIIKTEPDLQSYRLHLCPFIHTIFFVCYLTEVEMVCMPADFTQFRRRQIDNSNVYDRLAPTM